MSASTFWFLTVGGFAALTHVGVFAMVQGLMMAELANALGFGVAFVVSFAGHRCLSFRDARTPVGTCLRRFAITALAGFASNEVVFALLLRSLKLPSLLALWVALMVAAGQTFVLSRYWAFSR